MGVLQQEDVVRIMERLRKENDNMRAALVLVDRYFMACATKWNAEGKGDPHVNGPELDELGEEAANAVGAIMRPGDFT